MPRASPGYTQAPVAQMQGGCRRRMKASRSRVHGTHHAWHDGLIVAWPMNPTPSLSELLALAVVALVLGMRHGVDADHLAAIDAMTRCNADARPALARRTGLWFSIG